MPEGFDDLEEEEQQTIIANSKKSLLTQIRNAQGRGPRVSSNSSTSSRPRNPLNRDQA